MHDAESADSTSESDDSGGEEGGTIDRASTLYKSKLCKRYQQYLRGKRKGRKRVSRCEAGEECTKVHIAGPDAKQIMGEFWNVYRMRSKLKGLSSYVPPGS